MLEQEDVEKRIEELEEEIRKRKEYYIKGREMLLEMYRNTLKEMNKLYYVKIVPGSWGYLNYDLDKARYRLSDLLNFGIYKTKFTKQEIIDIDERLWQFAIPVKDDCE